MGLFSEGLIPKRPNAVSQHQDLTEGIDEPSRVFDQVNDSTAYEKETGDLFFK